MAFKKSQLAMAVAMAISLSAQAQINNSGSITLDGKASVTTANAATTTKDFVEVESSINDVFEKAPSSPSSVYHGDGESLLEIRDGQLNVLDMDLQDIDPNKEEFLSTGSESTFVIDTVTSAQTFIETNGAHIEHNGSAAAIAISNSNLTGVDFDIVDGDEPIPDSLLGHKELITNNGGEIISSDEYLTDPAATPGNAIDISKSTVNGVIINEDWSGSEAPMTGGLIASTGGAAISVKNSQWHGGVINSSRNAVSEISGGTAGIELINTDFVGAIINEALGDPALNLPVISGEQSAIRVVGGSFKGDIDNSGLLLVGDGYDYDTVEYQAEGAIALRDTRFEGNIVNNGEISNQDEFGNLGDKAAIVAERTQVIGNIINNGQMQGAISVDGSKHEWTDADENGNYTWADTAGHGSMQGNIVNTGQIENGYGRGAIDIYGADLTGSIINEGIIDSGSEGIRISGGYISQGINNEGAADDIYSSESTRGTRLGVVKGNIVNQQDASINSGSEGIELVSLNLTGNIENAGTIATQYGSGIAVQGGFEASETHNNSGYKQTNKSTQSTINGNIINHNTGIIAINGPEDLDGIHLRNVALNGNIENHGSITTTGSGIGIKGGEEFQVETTWSDNENSHQVIDTGLWQSQTSKLTGDIINTGTIVAGDGGIYINDGAELHGNLINRGSIQAGVSGIALDGGYRESGTVIHTEGSDKDLSQLEVTKLPSAFNGSIINEGSIESQGTGIDLSGLTANASISNRGTINGADTGIYIADDVTGNLTINQLAGELNGATALRMNKVTRTNYIGGSINGNVENHGGTFYVEGNRSIAGDYMQTAGSTLAMGLHKETSLTADNIDLKAGSRVLIDLTKGDLYVQNGTKVEILKANGTLTNADVDYVVNSKLVTAKAERNAAGNLELTFERGSYNETIKEDLKKNVGGISSTKAKNLDGLTNVFDKLDRLPNTPVVEKLKLMIQKSFSNNSDSVGALDEYLPDTSGASVAGAMNASSQSGTQISVRARGLASGDAFANSGLWMQGLVSNGKQDNRYGDGYDADSRGFVLGADTELNSGLVIGAAYSFINSESDTANSSTDSDYHMATAYTAQSLGQVLLDGQAYYAWGDNDSQRNIGASANYDSNLMGARVGAGYQFELGQATRFVPSLSLEASRLSVDGYTENGSPAALTIGSQDFNRLELGLSTELSKDYQLTYAMVTPSLTLGAFHDFEAEAQGSTVAFAAAPAETFTVTGRDPEKNRYVAGVGLEIMNGENLTVSAEYNYNWNGDGFDANAAALKFRWDF